MIERKTDRREDGEEGRERGKKGRNENRRAGKGNGLEGILFDSLVTGNIKICGGLYVCCELRLWAVLHIFIFNLSVVRMKSLNSFHMHRNFGMSSSDGGNALLLLEHAWMKSDL